MNGYIKLHRKLVNWEWYTDQNTFKLFIHCLLMANHKPNKWRGIVIDAGEFITSFDKLKIETGLSIQQVRTSLKRLILTKEIEHKSTSQYSVIKVLKYSDYQSLDDETNKQNNKQLTSNQQATNKQLTTNKNDKNDKNDKNKEYIGAFDQFILDNPEYKECLNAYKKMRVDMKKKMQPRAEVTFINKLKSLIAKGHDGIELVDTAIERNWLSIYEPNSFKSKPITKSEVDMPDYMKKNKNKGGYERVE